MALLQIECKRDPSGRSLIHVEVALSTQRNAATLLKMWAKRKTAGNAVDQALWDGYWYTNTKANQEFRDATELGQLLFCFPDTTVMQGGAA